MLFSLPSVADVRAAAKMRVEQYNPQISSAQFDEEIASHIQSAADTVTDAILETAGDHAWPFSEAQVALLPSVVDASEEIARQSRLATNATKAQALSLIWEEAGQLNDEYDEESDRLAKLASSQIETLQNAIRRVAAAIDKAASPAPMKFSRQGSSSASLVVRF